MLSFLGRLILFLIAISVIRSAVNFVQRLWLGVQQHSPRSVAHQPRGERAATVLQQDPVCGTYVAVDSSFKRVVSGRVVHFCSVECRDRYKV